MATREATKRRELKKNVPRDAVREMRGGRREQFVSPKKTAVGRVWRWGPVSVARYLWDRTGLGQIVSAAARPELGEIAFALTANRLVEPCCIRGMANWLEKNFVPVSDWRRLELGWLTKGHGTSRTLSGDFWDGAIRGLGAKRRVVEKGLLKIAQKASGDSGEAAVYELQTDFVEGERSRSRFASLPSQRNTIRLFLGAIMCGEWPVSVHLFGGSEPTPLQLWQFIKQSQRRFGFSKALVVFPPGTEEEKLRQVKSQGFDYLVGVRRRRDPKAVEVIREAGAQWVTIDPDRKAQEVYLPSETDASLDTSSAEPVPSERYFLVHSRLDEREERAFRVAIVERSLRALEELKAVVDSGRLKNPAAITEQAERILGHNKSYRYVSWRLTPEGRLRFWEDKQKSLVQRSYEGISLLKTSDQQLSASSAVGIYDRLRRLENAFDSVYDACAFRPTPLPLPELEESSSGGKFSDLFAGHLLVSQLAFILRRRLESILREKKIGLSVEDAIEALGSIAVAEVCAGQEKRLVVSAGSPTASKIIRALGIEIIEPPASPAPQQRALTGMRT